MDVHSLAVEMTTGGTRVSINGDLIGGVQRMTIVIDAEKSPNPSVSISYWSKIGSSAAPMLASDLVKEYAGTFGAYVTPFTNNLELVSDSIYLVDPEV